MIDEISVNPTESATPDVATDIPANGVDNSATETTEAQPEVTTEQPQESVEKAEETQEVKPEDDPRVPQQLRDHLKGLEKDLRTYKPAYTGLEKAATELFGTQNPEDIQATLETMKAAAPLLKVVLDTQSTPTQVVQALQNALPAEHMESVAWAALNDPATQAVIFDDPEVLKTISDKFFNGRSLEDVQALLESNPETEVDPEREAWRNEQKLFKQERERETSERNQRATQERTNQLMTRFFETPAQTVIAEDFKLVAPEGSSEADKQLFSDTAKDIRFAAQGRFLEENMDAYMQIQNLYSQGRGLQAQAAEIRLQNKYHATLIKVAERNANLLKSRSVSQVNGQQAKINGVRPDVTGSVDGTTKTEEHFDIDAPDFAQKFAASFHN